MFRDEKVELKVGLFVGIGMVLMFLIVFSIKDITLIGKGYGLNVLFKYVNGLTENSPVRFAGVHVGEVRDIQIYNIKETGETQVRVNVRVKSNIQIEDDSIARINTLGLLGEQYLELSPGKSKNFLPQGATIIGRDPVQVQKQMERVNEFMASMSTIVDHVAKGEGTIGRLLMEDTIYDDLEVIFGRLRGGEGTVGKLLVEEKIYNDMEDFVADIKANPWKLLSKPRKTRQSTTQKRGTEIGTR